MTPSLPGLTVDELAAALGSATRARHVLRWLHAEPTVPATLPTRLPGIEPRAWAGLVATTAWQPPVVRERRASPDGTTKYALAFGDDARRDGAHPRARAAARSASRARPAARAAASSAPPRRSAFARHLRAGEIVAQYLVAARARRRPTRPRATSSSWAWASRWTTSTRCCARCDVLTAGPAPQLRAAVGHRLHLGRAAGHEAVPRRVPARSSRSRSTPPPTSSAQR